MKNTVVDQPVHGSEAPVQWTEARLQQECICWFNKHYRSLSDLLFHIPNGGFRNQAEAARLKAQGVKAGIPDLMLAVAGDNRKMWKPGLPLVANGLFIELKTPTGRLSAEQASYHQQLAAQGYRVEVVRSLEAFTALLTEYLA